MTWIPAICGLDKFVQLRLLHEFNGAESRSPAKLFNETPVEKIQKIKDMVLIDFRHVPRLKLFRWDKQWWRKTSWKGGTSQISYHEFEFTGNQKVGVRLKDLNVELRRWIHQIETNSSS